MSPAITRTSPSDAHTEPHIRRRRHAAQSAGPNWARRAGVAGGVIGTLALTGMASSANAEQADMANSTAQDTAPGLATATTAATQAADAVDQAAVELQLQADQDHAASAALKEAKRAKEGRR